ncbi:MAG TPA: hypothetical protein VF796_29090, partial [Humisphaera sp.]
VQPRPSRRTNWRLVVFLMVIAAPFAWVIWSAVRHSMDGGVSADGLVDLKQLGNFEFDPDLGTIDDVPTRTRQLDGKRVVLRGFAVPDLSTPTVTRFQLVYDVMRRGTPLVPDRVYAHSEKPIAVPSYTESACELAGILHVRVVHAPAGPDGKPGPVTSLFDLDVESLKPWGEVSRPLHPR